MSVKLLTLHHFDFISLKGGCTGLSESTQNATLMEIKYHGSNYVFLNLSIDPEVSAEF